MPTKPESPQNNINHRNPNPQRQPENIKAPVNATPKKVPASDLKKNKPPKIAPPKLRPVSSIDASESANASVGTVKESKNNKIGGGFGEATIKVVGRPSKVDNLIRSFNRNSVSNPKGISDINNNKGSNYANAASGNTKKSETEPPAVTVAAASLNDSANSNDDNTVRRISSNFEKMLQQRDAKSEAMLKMSSGMKGLNNNSDISPANRIQQQHQQRKPQQQNVNAPAPIQQKTTAVATRNEQSNAALKINNFNNNKNTNNSNTAATATAIPPANSDEQQLSTIDCLSILNSTIIQYQKFSKTESSDSDDPTNQMLDLVNSMNPKDQQIINNLLNTWAKNGINL